jgi:Homeodomain-like domain-containing protein/HNH endonuclease
MATELIPEQPQPGTAVAPPRQAIRLLRPIAEPSEIVAAQNEMRAMVHGALKDGRDFGKIPGTDKPTLLKPGAERVALGFGCYYGEPIIVEREIDHDREVKWTKRKKKWRNAHQGDREFTWEEDSGVSLGLYRYVVRVQVINRDNGQVVGEGIGACSTTESKYIDRPRDSENTVLKMAHKRAIVAACLVTFGLSDEFTQDVESEEDLALFNKAQWQRDDRASFRDDRGYSKTADYATGKNRDAVLARDGNACVVCGMTDAEHKAKWNRPITVDHISRDRSDNSMENLQTLCLACHGAKDISPELIEPRVPAKKQEVLTMRANGASYKEIAAATGFSVGAVWKWVQRWRDDDVKDTAPGQPAPITRDSEITWGKQKGTAIKDLPDDYLKWAVQDGRKFGADTAKWQAAMREEIKRRAAERGTDGEADDDDGELGG